MVTRTVFGPRGAAQDTSRDVRALSAIDTLRSTVDGHGPDVRHTEPLPRSVVIQHRIRAVRNRDQRTSGNTPVLAEAGECSNPQWSMAARQGT